MRFYPDTLPPFPNEPTTDRFRICRISAAVGEGVITLSRFKPGDTVFSFTGFLTTEITQYSLQIRRGMHLHDPFFMGKVLHSCDPNTSCNMRTRTFTALKPILPGDLITMDYAETEEVLYKPFPCSCGAADCRGFVTGKRQVGISLEDGIPIELIKGPLLSKAP
jgi:hypothetical protein